MLMFIHFLFYNFLQGSEFLEGYSINVTKTYKKHKRCKPKRLYAPITERTSPAADLSELPVLHELDNNNIIEGAARSSRSSATDGHGGMSAATRNNCGQLSSCLLWLGASSWWLLLMLRTWGAGATNIGRAERRSSKRSSSSSRISTGTTV